MDDDEKKLKDELLSLWGLCRESNKRRLTFSMPAPTPASYNEANGGNRTKQMMAAV
jgi:hypothetical protein